MVVYNNRMKYDEVVDVWKSGFKKEERCNRFHCKSSAFSRLKWQIIYFKMVANGKCSYMVNDLKWKSILIFLCLPSLQFIVSNCLGWNKASGKKIFRIHCSALSLRNKLNSHESDCITAWYEEFWDTLLSLVLIQSCSTDSDLLLSTAENCENSLF